jgi:hypothetical protein
MWGPLPTINYRPNNWTNHARFQYAYDRSNPHTLPYHREPASISAFYQDLARRPAGSLSLLEAPWYLDWGSNVYPSYQRVHRQWMMVGFVRDENDGSSGPLFNELAPWLASGFRNFVHVGAHAEIVARGVDYVVFHRNLDTELPNPGRRPRPSVTAWIEEYRGRYGAPVYRDSSIVVFDVRRTTR